MATPKSDKPNEGEPGGGLIIFRPPVLHGCRISIVKLEKLTYITEKQFQLINFLRCIHSRLDVHMIFDRGCVENREIVVHINA